MLQEIIADLGQDVIPLSHISVMQYQAKAKAIHQWPLLLAWFNFNPIMDK